MVAIRHFRELDAWKVGHLIVLEVYRLTSNFPKDEMFGLISQIRRAVVSDTSNIAEGFSRGSISEKKHFYSMAHGSLLEVENQALIAKDLGYITQTDYDALLAMCERQSRLLHGLMKSAQGRGALN